VTVLVSLVTRPRADHELKGLVYSLTERVHDTQSQWYMRPATLGIVVLVGTLALNLLFW
jgi:SSS family solute:Na+ symporter